MSLNKEVIEKNLDYIRETMKTNTDEFLIAFFLYEINGTKKEELTEDMINSVYLALEEFEDADKDQQEELLSFFDKYNPIDKEEEEELEK